MLGFDAGELLGHSIHELIHHSRADGTAFPAELCPIYVTLRTGQVQSHVRDVFWTKQRTPIPIEYSCSPIREENVIRGCVVTFSDISRRLLLEEQLEREKRLSSLGRIAATIAHEINNVLMAIQTFADLSRKISAEGDQRLGRALRHIIDAVQRGKEITGDILRFTRPAPPRTKDVDLVEWMRSFASMMRGVIREDIKLELDLPKDPVIITADPAQLHQVFSNLLLNARDAIHGSGSISLRVSLAAGKHERFELLTKPTAFAYLGVRDTGMGIDANQMSLIFEPLFTTKQHGTGLGLAVTHQIVTAHGGMIFVDSTVGAGSTFHLFLPLNDRNRASETTQLRSSAG
jgi:signal transduction histidine kinase